MALYTGRILMRIGNEAAYDIDKLMPGEWAVSTDKRIVRICILPGIGIRMATYEAFEEDMVKIENILNESQSIQEAIVRINAEVSEKADAVAEYTEQAKKYRDEAESFKNEAKQFRNEAFSNTPEGYENLVQNVADNTVKIDTVINKAELNIKNTASGDSIHLTDSADSKAIEFAIYGKAKQNTTSGKNILQFNRAINLDFEGGKITANKHSGKMTINGTTNKSYRFEDQLNDSFSPKVTGIYLLTGSPTDNCELGIFGDNLGNVYKDETKTVIQNKFQGETYKEIQYYLEAGVTYHLNYMLSQATFNNVEICPMLRLAGTDDTFEPYTGGLPSPNPDYPQEIKVSGASGSVIVKSCGKNILNHNILTQEINGLNIIVNDDKTILVNGTPTTRTAIHYTIYLDKGSYIFSSSPYSESTDFAAIVQPTKNNVATDTIWDFGRGGVKFTIDEDNTMVWLNLVRIEKDYTANNLLFKPMIRKCDENGNPIGDNTYEPYKEISTTIPTPNGLAGIPTDSGGNYTDADGQQWICDEIVKYADGSGERIQRIKKVIYDGTNMKFSAKSSSTTNNIFYSDSTTMDFKMPSSYDSLPNIISSHFVRCSRNDGYDGSGKCIYGSSTYPNIYIGFGGDSEITTVDLANAWLQENNVTVYYELANPIRTPLTSEEIAEIEKLQTFYPITYIANDSDCGMKVSYLADSKNYIDNQLALQAQAQEAAMINMLLLLPEETQAAMIENDTNNLLTESEE